MTNELLIAHSESGWRDAMEYLYRRAQYTEWQWLEQENRE